MACPEVLGGLKYTPEEVVEFKSLDDRYPEQMKAKREQNQKARTTRKPKPEEEAAPASEPSGRDWEAELDDCATAQDVRNLWKACAKAGELTDELKSTFQAAGTALTTAENNTEEEVVDGVLVDENGEIQDNAA